VREVTGKRDKGTVEKSRRPVVFAERNGFVDCPTYYRYQLFAGDRVAGPAIVEEFDSTTVIHPGYEASVDRYGNLLLGKL